jgi:hypothetical protein
MVLDSNSPLTTQDQVHALARSGGWPKSRDALYDDLGAEQEKHAGKMRTSRAKGKSDKNPLCGSPVIDR